MPPMAQLDAETLFQTRSVAEIREIENRTRHQIEEKKTQLRQVVGDSYRDLISSADTIVGISQQSESVSRSLDLLQQKLDSLAESVESRRSGASPDQAAASSFDKLFAVGSRIRYLIDTPETIYGCLDAREFLDAAQRYVRAVEVHRGFASQPKSAAKRFPLLRHHWPLVKKLGAETWDRSVDWLRSQGGATPQQLAGVLAGLSLLRPVDGAEVLKHHLAARQAYIASCLSAAAVGDAALDPESLAVVLSDVAELVCSTVAQCGELFLTRPGVTAQPLMLQVATQEDVGANELLFDPGAVSKESAEKAAWRRHRAAACERLAGLSAAGVGLECSEWLEGLAAALTPLCEKLLEGCDSGAALHTVEAGVQAALGGWRYSLGGTEELSWSDACQWVVGRPVALWPLLLEGPLVSRAKGLVASKFEAVSSTAGGMIQATLNESTKAPGGVPGGPTGLAHWSEPLTTSVDGLNGAQGRGGMGSSGGVRRKSSASLRGGDGDAVHASSQWWLPKAEALLAAVDANLEAALTAALAVTAAGGNGGGAATNSNGSTGRPGSAAGGQRWMSPAATAAAAQNAGPSPRAVVLQPFVQETCFAAVEAVASALATAVGSLPEEAAIAGDDSFAPAAAAALFVGRVAQGMAERSAPLRLLLGPPAAWSAAAAASAAARASPRKPTLNRTSSVSGRPLEVSPRLDAAQRRLTAIAGDAYARWSTWAARGLAERLVLDFTCDGALASDTPLRGWEEAVLAGGEEGGGDVKFLLPAAPSPAAMAAALGVCREVERAGGHAADDAAVQLLRWHLGGDVCGALRAAFSAGGPLGAEGAVSEKGLLQLLLDLRFLISLLAGQPPAGASAAAAPARLREIAGVEAELSGLIDPIDWATYEMHLYARVTQFNARCKALLGLAARGAPLLKSGNAAAAPMPQPAESNILRMASAGPRFAYLPVNTPSTLRQGRTPAVAPAAAAALLDDGEETHYSFASLKTKRVARGPASVAGADGRDGGSGMGASALDALRQSTLGSLLGDKAAEVSATLGEYSFSNLSAGSSGLFSSLTSFNKR